jgi:hypothetical protein
LIELVDQPLGEAHWEVRFPAQAITQGKARLDLPRILRVESRVPLPDQKRIGRRLRQTEQIPGKEICQTQISGLPVEAKLPHRQDPRVGVRIPISYVRAERNLMLASHPGNVFSHLERRGLICSVRVGCAADIESARNRKGSVFGQIAENIDSHVLRSKELGANACDPAPIECRAERIHGIRADDVGIA